MKKVLQTGAFFLALATLTSCSQNRLCCNRYTEKDCYFGDYYQSQPLCPRDQNYYHSDPVR